MVILKMKNNDGNTKTNGGLVLPEKRGHLNYDLITGIFENKEGSPFNICE